MNDWVEAFLTSSVIGSVVWCVFGCIGNYRSRQAVVDTLQGEFVVLENRQNALAIPVQEIDNKMMSLQNQLNLFATMHWCTYVIFASPMKEQWDTDQAIASNWLHVAEQGRPIPHPLVVAGCHQFVRNRRRSVVWLLVVIVLSGVLGAGGHWGLRSLKEDSLGPVATAPPFPSMRSSSPSATPSNAQSFLTTSPLAAPNYEESSITMAAILTREHLVCGVTPRLGFATLNEEGYWEGFEVDLCRAIAVGIFGTEPFQSGRETEPIEIVPVEAHDRFLALANKTIDVLFGMTSQTQERTFLEVRRLCFVKTTILAIRPPFLSNFLFLGHNIKGVHVLGTILGERAYLGVFARLCLLRSGTNNIKHNRYHMPKYQDLRPGWDDPRGATSSGPTEKLPRKYCASIDSSRVLRKLQGWILQHSRWRTVRCGPDHPPK